MECNKNPDISIDRTRGKIKFKHLRRISQYICAVAYVEIHKNRPKFRPANDDQQVCGCKLSIFCVISHQNAYLTTYIARNVARFSSKKDSSNVKNLSYKSLRRKDDI